MKRSLSILFVLLISTSVSFSQEEKDIESALKLFQKDKEKGIAKMEKTMIGSTNSKYWDVMVKMYHERFQEKDGGNSMTNPVFSDFVNTCRRATLASRSPLASEYLRKLFSENEPDSLVSQSNKILLQKGDESMKAKDYPVAQKYYQQAIRNDARFFKARIDAGECYRYMKMPDSAIAAYKQAIAINADYVDAWKGLVDAMIDKNDFIFVIDQAINGLIVYPDEELFNRFYYIQSKQHKTINRYWFPRKYTINSLKLDNEPVEEEPWKTYRAAKEEIKSYCNKDGVIIVDNNLTKTKYMEVYAWEKMLKRPECIRIAFFDFARKMQSVGYLDCYVFFAMFHNDLYNQYESFSSNNKKKITSYIEKHMTVK